MEEEEKKNKFKRFRKDYFDRQSDDTIEQIGKLASKSRRSTENLSDLLKIISLRKKMEEVHD